MEDRQSVFYPKKLLPPNIQLKSVDSHLYKIGLSLFPNVFIKRRKFHNPLLIFIIQSYLLIQSLISLFSSENNPDFYIIIGEFAYYIDARVHIDIAASLITFLSIVSQILHYMNYRNGIKPSYLKPFEMMSGLVSPQSIDLTNKDDVYKIIKMAKILFYVWKFVSILLLFTGFTISFWSFFQKTSTKLFLIFGIVYSIMWGISCYNIYSIIISQIVYFYIICYYLKCKIFRINEKIRNFIKISKFEFSSNTDLVRTIYSLNSIYEEIDNYNSNYWSKFLFWIWISLASIINTLAYQSIFGKMDFGKRFMVIYVCIIFVWILLLVIKTASSVYFEANKSYKLLNSFTASLSGTKLSNLRSLKV